MRFIKNGEKKNRKPENVLNFCEKHHDYWLKDRRTKVQNNEEKTNKLQAWSV